MNLEMIKKAVDAQAEDDSIWFYADSVVEAYLQQSLRWLHAVIEDADEQALAAIMEQSEDHCHKNNN